MTQLSAIFVHADRLRSAAEQLEAVMKRMDERSANESLAPDLDDAMAEVVSASDHAKRLAVLINEARAALREIEAMPCRSRKAQDVARRGLQYRPGDYFKVVAAKRVRETSDV